MSEINKRQDEIIEEFSVFDDWMDCYAYLIDFGKKLSVLSDNDKNNQILIKG